jgi:hypothetical protein
MSRLGRLYTRVEQIRSLERRVASSAVEEAELATEVHTAAYEAHISSGRAALGMGDRAEYTIAQLSREVARQRIAHLDRLRAEREAVLTSAVEAHRESRLSMEQVERLISRSSAEAALEAARREQAQADDRFGSRSAYTAVNSIE